MLIALDIEGETVVKKEYLICRNKHDQIIELIPRGKVRLVQLPESIASQISTVERTDELAAGDQFQLSRQWDSWRDQTEAMDLAFFQLVDYLCSQGWEPFAAGQEAIHFVRPID